MSGTLKMLRSPVLYLSRHGGMLFSYHNSQKLASVASACCTHFSTDGKEHANSPNQDYVVSKVFQNRNPRNLEKMALARKRIGWQFQAPRKDYYHKLVISFSTRHTDAWIEHCTGEKVLTASTKEWAIRNQLYSCTDVVASASVGQILALRCLRSGINCVFFDEVDMADSSEKLTSILKAFKDVHISLNEPSVIMPPSKPGINYDGYNRYAEPKVWQEDYQHVQ